MSMLFSKTWTLRQRLIYSLCRLFFNINNIGTKLKRLILKSPLNFPFNVLGSFYFSLFKCVYNVKFVFLLLKIDIILIGNVQVCVYCIILIKLVHVNMFSPATRIMWKNNLYGEVILYINKIMKKSFEYKINSSGINTHTNIL